MFFCLFLVRGRAGTRGKEQGSRGAGEQGSRAAARMLRARGWARWRVTGIAGTGERKAVQTSMAVVIAKTLVYI